MLVQYLQVCIHFTCTNHPLDAYVGGVYLFGEFLHSLSGVLIRVWIHIGLYPREWDLQRRNTTYSMQYYSVLHIILEHETADNPHIVLFQQYTKDKIQVIG